jgi:hypothetical protein
MMISTCKIKHWETTSCLGGATPSFLCEKWLLGGGYGPTMEDLVGEEVAGVDMEEVGMGRRDESHEYRDEREKRE